MLSAKVNFYAEDNLCISILEFKSDKDICKYIENNYLCISILEFK